MSQDFDTILKVPAKTLACLRRGYLTIFVGHGLGGADGGIPHEIPSDLVPFDLRTPNSEFTLLMDRVAGRFIGVERRSDDGQVSGNRVDSA